ncbi:hypothetical protein QQ045_003783 [Rhodiola kirilowii]
MRKGLVSWCPEEGGRRKERRVCLTVVRLEKLDIIRVRGRFGWKEIEGSRWRVVMGSSLMIYRRRLSSSPANSHEALQLELPGLGEASNSSCPERDDQGSSSPGGVLIRDKNEDSRMG